MTTCKYGDPTCPCQDGDPCHYEPHGDTPAMNVPPEYVLQAVATKVEICAEITEEIRREYYNTYKKPGKAGEGVMESWYWMSVACKRVANTIRAQTK